MSVDSKVERNLKSIKICTSDGHYPKYALHVFPDTAAIFNYNKVMIDQINGMPKIQFSLVAGFQIVSLWQLEIALFLKQVTYEKL